MIAVLGGLGAAVAWAVTMLTASRASPLIGSWSTLAWVMLTGLLVVGPVALVAGAGRTGLDGGALVWLAIAGVGNITGLLLVYTGLRIGKVGVVAPISSTEGAVAAVIAVVAGETLGVVDGGRARRRSPSASSSLHVRRRSAEEAGHDDPRAAACFALAAALAFGAGLYATGRASLELPIAWAVLPPRLLGVVFVTVPLALVGAPAADPEGGAVRRRVGTRRGRRLRLVRDRRAARDRDRGRARLAVRRARGGRGGPPVQGAPRPAQASPAWS